MIPVSTLVWFLATLLMMGFFAGVEMGFYSVNRFGIELKKKQGKSWAARLSDLLDSPEPLLATTLIGFTIFLVSFVLLFNTVTAYLWNMIGLRSDSARLVLDIILAAFVVLVLAEFLPRALFRARANLLLSRLVPLISFFYNLLQPIADAFIRLSDWVLRYLFNVRIRSKKASFSRTSTDTLFQSGTEADAETEEFDTQLFENALDLPKVKIRQCLVPRKEVIGLDAASDVETARQKFIDTKLSKLVLFDGNIDNITGYIHQLDIFKNPSSLSEILLAIPAVPQTMSAIDLISKFTREGKSIAWVVDEFGGTAGIVTMEDVLEEIFGEIHDEYDSEEFVERQIAENEYIFSGRLELDYLTQKYELSFPEGESETLSGFIISQHETIPTQKERIIIDDYEFDIISVSDTRIEMVKLKLLK